MFSGIIEVLGGVRRNDAGRLTIDCVGLQSLRSGESIAVNGCCLTVAELAGVGFSADVMPETARRTTLGTLAPGDQVNLERALRAGEPIGGHLVTGHVDETGVVSAVEADANARRVRIEAPTGLLELVAPQGSIAVDGISLTVVDVSAAGFSVSLIPYTTAITSAGRWKVGSRVNLEADLVARYLRRLLISTHTAPVTV
jgi:riboflavin synthase